MAFSVIPVMSMDTLQNNYSNRSSEAPGRNNIPDTLATGADLSGKEELVKCRLGKERCLMVLVSFRFSQERLLVQL